MAASSRRSGSLSCLSQQIRNAQYTTNTARARQWKVWGAAIPGIPEIKEYTVIHPRVFLFTRFSDHVGSADGLPVNLFSYFMFTISFIGSRIHSSNLFVSMNIVFNHYFTQSIYGWKRLVIQLVMLNDHALLEREIIICYPFSNLFSSPKLLLALFKVSIGHI